MLLGLGWKRDQWLNLSERLFVRYDSVGQPLVLDRSPTTAPIRLLSSLQRVWIEIG
jgi:hypothetical protein